MACALRFRWTDGGLATTWNSAGMPEAADRAAASCEKDHEPRERIVASAERVAAGAGGAAPAPAAPHAAPMPPAGAPAACVPVASPLVPPDAGSAWRHRISRSSSPRVSSCDNNWTATSLSSNPPARARRRLRPSASSAPTRDPARLYTRNRPATTAGGARGAGTGGEAGPEGAASGGTSGPCGAAAASASLRCLTLCDSCSTKKRSGPCDGCTELASGSTQRAGWSSPCAPASSTTNAAIALGGVFPSASAAWRAVPAMPAGAACRAAPSWTVHQTTLTISSPSLSGRPLSTCTAEPSHSPSPPTPITAPSSLRRCAPRADRRSRNGPSIPRRAQMRAVSPSSESRPSATTHNDAHTSSPTAAGDVPAGGLDASACTAAGDVPAGCRGSLKLMVMRWRDASRAALRADPAHADGTASTSSSSCEERRRLESSRAGRRARLGGEKPCAPPRVPAPASPPPSPPPSPFPCLAPPLPAPASPSSSANPPAPPLSPPTSTATPPSPFSSANPPAPPLSPPTSTSAPARGSTRRCSGGGIPVARHTASPSASTVAASSSPPGTHTIIGGPNSASPPVAAPPSTAPTHRRIRKYKSDGAGEGQLASVARHSTTSVTRGAIWAWRRVEDSSAGETGCSAVPARAGSEPPHRRRRREKRRRNWAARSDDAGGAHESTAGVHLASPNAGGSRTRAECIVHSPGDGGPVSGAAPDSRALSSSANAATATPETFSTPSSATATAPAAFAAAAIASASASAASAAAQLTTSETGMSACSSILGVLRASFASSSVTVTRFSAAAAQRRSSAAASSSACTSRKIDGGGRGSASPPPRQGPHSPAGPSPPPAAALPPDAAEEVRGPASPMRRYSSTYADAPDSACEPPGPAGLPIPSASRMAPGRARRTKESLNSYQGDSTVHKPAARSPKNRTPSSADTA
eukprot:scaffold1290_cov115-Isochrysis_galbana.AAC.1